MDIQAKAALERLIELAKGDTWQCRKVADFLLSWWNAPECGAWDVTDVRWLDRQITDDIFAVLALIAHENCYPDSLGYEDDFGDILVQWRPQFFTELTVEDSQ